MKRSGYICIYITIISSRCSPNSTALHCLTLSSPPFNRTAAAVPSLIYLPSSPSLLHPATRSAWRPTLDTQTQRGIMLARRIISHLKPSSVSQFSSLAKGVEEGKSGVARKAVSFILITVTGGVALSALDDLAIYLSCSRKAMEKARTNKAVIDALGEPIEKGPWYDASLAVAHKRRTASCSFPVSGPRGNGSLQLKAVRNGDDRWFSYLLHPLDWEILIMEALLHVPGNEEQMRTFRVNLTDVLSPARDACTSCPSSALKSPPQ